MGRRLKLSENVGELVDEVCAEDRQWFERHPNATARLRDMVEGEFAPLTLTPPCGFFYAVRVEVVCPGVRRRLPVLIANYD